MCKKPRLKLERMSGEGDEGKCAKDQISQRTLVPKIEIVIQHTIYDLNYYGHL